MVSIARKNLFFDLPRFIVAQAGIMFAVGLVTIQTGIYNGFTRSSTILIDHAEADLWMAHEDMRHLDLTLPIPYRWATEAKTVEGVAEAEALVSRGSIWRYAFGELSVIRIIGLDPQGDLFNPQPLVAGQLSDLDQPYTITVDALDQESLDVSGINHTAEIGSYRARVVGITDGVRSIVSNPFVFTSLENANAFNSPIAPASDSPDPPPPLSSESEISFVLIRATSDTSLAALKQRLMNTFPGSRVVTQAELAQITQDYWRNSTGVGYILGLGAVVGVIVGTVVVGQILYSSVADHIREFGTLKAMGSSDWFIYRVILEQALWMAVLGYIPGMLLSMGVGSWTLNAQAIQILINPVTAAAVFVVTVVMCSGAAIFAIQKVTRLDPAIVFKS
ncbi:ABC transporter permease [Lyngbya confervoides]|uniref:FtsX-like permease family protein n=1 Tax=Lyngbya confervoides BDU141951 TaxID=1574623 RepID=A0ABD4T654_9CYAN|nr:FtsX-like permease family protein [Lyngbya confervoides]MCM1983929.1 FtsX-like permease family protein [Lyngbya confervoides BDU141951]